MAVSWTKSLIPIINCLAFDQIFGLRHFMKSTIMRSFLFFRGVTNTAQAGGSMEVRGSMAPQGIKPFTIMSQFCLGLVFIWLLSVLFLGWSFEGGRDKQGIALVVKNVMIAKIAPLNFPTMHGVLLNITPRTFPPRKIGVKKLIQIIPVRSPRLEHQHVLGYHCKDLEHF
jgi:hypothetical protein